jgi:hypothetical protein
METGFGERSSVDLLPGGSNLPVTLSNVSHYCELYAQHLLVHSIHKQFAAFQRGFLRLCSGAALQLFRCASMGRVRLLQACVGKHGTCFLRAVVRCVVRRNLGLCT